MRRSVALLVLGILTAVLGSLASPGAVLAVQPPVSHEVMTRRADLVVEGEVASVTRLGAGRTGDSDWVEYRAVIRILRVHKGKLRPGDTFPMGFSVYTWRGKGEPPPHLRVAPDYLPCERVGLYLKQVRDGAYGPYGYVAWNAKGNEFPRPTHRLPGKDGEVARCAKGRPD